MCHKVNLYVSILCLIVCRLLIYVEMIFKKNLALSFLMIGGHLYWLLDKSFQFVG